MAKLLFEHFIVLMLENRSFDHLFGYLGKGDGLPKGGATNYLKPTNSKSEAFSSRKGGDYTAIGQGPSHSLKQTNEQLFGQTKPTPAVSVQTPPLNGFVASFKEALTYDLKRQPTSSELQQVMNCFDPVQLPVLSTLAQSFVLCDRWFADVPGPTMPNRAFVHAATSQGYTYNADWKPKFNCKTLYDRINANKSLSWRSYYHDQDDILELYPYLEKDETNHVQFEGNFVSDVAGDKLATYSFITPAFLNSPQHPTNSMHAPADVRPAEKLVADVYSALRSQPDVWKKTLLIVVFDEHGGYYDHVPPPATVSPDGIAGRMDQSFLVPFDFKRLGLRVPAILISPWFKAGVDFDRLQPLDHSRLDHRRPETAGRLSHQTRRQGQQADREIPDRRRQADLAHRCARRRRAGAAATARSDGARSAGRDGASRSASRPAQHAANQGYPGPGAGQAVHAHANRKTSRALLRLERTAQGR